VSAGEPTESRGAAGSPAAHGQADSAAVVDHLVLAAATLEQGVAWCETTLGITPGPGGRHPLMGTHNRLFSIASTAFPLAYFEIIAIDPEAPPPGRVRWFGLDEPALRVRIAHQPQLVHVVARSPTLARHRAALMDAGLQPGVPVSAGRDTPQGRLQWQILVRDDGHLPCAGALPTLIQWQDRHPAEQMPVSGVALQGLVLNGLPGAVRAVLGLPGVTLGPLAGPAIGATLATPRGEVHLASA
jgi:hypothetical protein